MRSFVASPHEAVSACSIMTGYERSSGTVSSLVAVTSHKYGSCRCIEGTSKAQGLDRTLQETATPEQYKLFMSGYCAKCLNFCSCSWAAISSFCPFIYIYYALALAVYRRRNVLLKPPWSHMNA